MIRFIMDIFKFSFVFPKASRVMDKGYSINRVNDKILTNIDNVKVGDTLVTELKNGKLTSKVVEVEKNGK